MKDFITKNWIALTIALALLIFLVYKSKEAKKNCSCANSGATTKNPLTTAGSNNDAVNNMGLVYFDDPNTPDDGTLMRNVAGKPCAVGAHWDENGVCAYDKQTGSANAVYLG